MCGFAGYINNYATFDKMAVIKAMADRIVHRGPDDAHYYVDEDISLGFRRLSIIDLEGGRQPILNEDGSLVLLFNGEIYNYQSIREDLLKAGHVFKTKTDSEVILHGYEEYGKKVLDRLRGMFAFIIWNKQTKELFGARDIFGIKPFYYYKKDGEFLFGSEIKSFLSHPKFEKELDEDMIPLYLSYEYIPDERTIFKNVYKLPGAHCFTYKDGKLEVERYYHIRYNIEEDKSLEYWEDAITKEFSESVAMHQISDVEVGCFLSSGVDSSYVVKEISKGTKKVKTFSVGYEEEKYSELPYAQDFSSVIGVQNIANKVSADEFFDAVPEIQYFMDEPLPNPSEIPLYFLAKNARKYVKVVLSGEGADELFGGYPMYLAGGHFDRYAHKVPRPVRKALGTVARHAPSFKGRNFLIRGAMEPYQRFMRANYVFQSAERQKYLKRPIASKAARGVQQALFRRGTEPRRADAAAVCGHAHLDDLRHPFEGRPHEHGELARAARAVPRPQDARALDAHPDALPRSERDDEDRPARRGDQAAARAHGQQKEARLPRAAERLAARGQVLQQGQGRVPERHRRKILCDRRAAAAARRPQKRQGTQHAEDLVVLHLHRLVRAVLRPELI